MMAERLIDANALTRHLIDKVGFYPAMVARAIKDSPTIDTVKRGKWFEMVEIKHDTYTDEYFDEVYYNCLECDYASDWKYPYCPNCGARMDGE